MRLHFKEEPKEWRKAALLSLIGPSVLIGILRWRHVVSWNGVAVALALAALVALCAWLRPRWFRGYYRFTTWLGFHIIQFILQFLAFLGQLAFFDFQNKRRLTISLEFCFNKR